MIFLLVLMNLAQDLPEGPGKDAVAKSCLDCHDASTITIDNRTKEGWQKTVKSMQNHGADVTEDQVAIIVAYLTKNFGRVNVNKATAEEIAAGLDFSAQESAAIVHYRETNGVYTGYKDLAKVVDAAKVEAKKNHIAVE
jgi:DNA uptake protein ComE-like DNA-binding protein